MLSWLILINKQYRFRLEINYRKKTLKMLKRDKNKTIKHGINIKVNRFISMLERASGLLKLVTCTALLYPQKSIPVSFRNNFVKF